jgi:hypothetical protein
LRDPNYQPNLDQIFSTYDPKQLITSFSTELAKYFVSFAGYGYCTLEEMESKTCCQSIFDKDGWLLHAYGKIDTDNYNFAILIHYEYKKVIITFPGTRSKLQLLYEILNSYATTFAGDTTERINGYFNNMYQKIKEQVDVPLTKLYLEFPDYQYIFTGHSLGASMAGILALDSVKYGHLNKTEYSPVLINYGMPRTGNDVFANELMKYIPQVYKVVRQGDIVTSMPLCHQVGFFDTTCQTFLKESKFNPDFTLTEEEKTLETQHFYGWHIGGLKLYTKEMDRFEDCGNDYGENNVNRECHLTKSVDVRRHDTYFGVRIHYLCSLI